MAIATTACSSCGKQVELSRTASVAVVLAASLVGGFAVWQVVPGLERFPPLVGVGLMLLMLVAFSMLLAIGGAVRVSKRAVFDRSAYLLLLLLMACIFAFLALLAFLAYVT